MTEVGMHAAKTNLSRLVKRAQAGEEIVISVSGKPAVRLVPVGERRRPVFGLDAGKIWVSPDFDEPMSGEELALWEGASKA